MNEHHHVLPFPIPEAQRITREEIFQQAYELRHLPSATLESAHHQVLLMEAQLLQALLEADTYVPADSLKDNDQST